MTILKNDRKNYYDILDRADRKDYEPLVRFIAQAVERSMNIYLKVVGRSAPKGSEYLPLSVIAKGTPYSDFTRLSFVAIAVGLAQLTLKHTVHFKLNSVL